MSKFAVKQPVPLPKLTFETLPAQHYPEWGFRPGTPMYPMDVNFIFMNGGMGDYICWMQAIRWLASEAKWIRGSLVMPVYFKEFAAHFLKEFPEWKMRDHTELKGVSQKEDTAPFRGPVNLATESLNATGAHLLTCGWAYFANKEKAPEGWDSYPQFKQEDLDVMELPPEAQSLVTKKYAVVTCGLTTNSRKVPGSYWNHVINHIISKGLTPVFLGKSKMETGNTANIHTKYSDEVRFDLGLDLREKTSILQAAAIMSRAAVVIGHDNGLLHLAGCTAVPIVFGYNIASPEHREPRRPVGKTYNVVLTQKELVCNFCQSKTNFVLGFVFRDCFYSDNLCITKLFENEAARWKTQIDLALADGETNVTE